MQSATSSNAPCHLPRTPAPSRSLQPDGRRLPDATVGVPYKSTHLDFTLNDGFHRFRCQRHLHGCRDAGGTPVVVGTGNSTISGITMGRKTRTGTYRLECTAATNGGTFKIVAPNGAALPNVGGNRLRGRTDQLHDQRRVQRLRRRRLLPRRRRAGIEKVTALAPSAVDGSEVAAGLLFDNTDATNGDKVPSASSATPKGEQGGTDLV